MVKVSTPGSLSAYERERLANIEKNKSVLLSLGLLEDAAILRDSGCSNKTKSVGPKKMKAKMVLPPQRPSSDRAKQLEEQARREREEQMKRRLEQEALAEERRQVARRLRKVCCQRSFT